MTEAMQKLSPSERQFAAREIEQVLSRWNLRATTAIRQDLESHVCVRAVRDCFWVSITDDSWQTVTIDQRLAQLKDDPAFSDCFPPDPPRISRVDHEKLHANFEAIRAGKILVE
jgi:hypothetical protein